MKSFSIGEVYLNRNKEKVIDINPLPENYCSFDCVFCSLGRTKVKTDKMFNFEETKKLLHSLEEILKKENIDIVFINPDGDLLAQSKILDVIKLIKKYNVKVKIISNGYLFNRYEYKKILNNCDEIIGELAVTNEEYFQKIQRPLEGYTLEEYISNMESFNKQYRGKFILDISILKNYSDSNEDVKKFKEFIKKINPDEILVETPYDGKLKNAFGIDEDRLKEIENLLKEVIVG
ncbi:MAG: radical SAM protein [Clostridiaceae bacterium]